MTLDSIVGNGPDAVPERTIVSEQERLIDDGHKLVEGKGQIQDIHLLRKWHRELYSNVSSLSRIPTAISEGDAQLPRRLRALEALSERMIKKERELIAEVWRVATFRMPRESMRVLYQGFLALMRPEFGNNVLDIASGKSPLSAVIADRPERMKVAVDVVPPDNEQNFVHVSADINELLDEPGALRRKIDEAVIASGMRDKPPPMDSVILASALNYFPLDELLDELDKCLRPGGTVFIENIPGVTMPGFESLLIHPRAMRTNSELVNALESRGYRMLIHVETPVREGHTSDNAALVAVFRKEGPIKKWFNELKLGKNQLDDQTEY